MKAANVLKKEIMVIQELPMPEIGPGEALIEIRYAGVCGSDIVVYRDAHPTTHPPVVLGHEIFGVIRDIRPAAGVLAFQVGDRVTAEPLMFCGVCEACRQGFGNVCGNLRLIGIHENGAYAQYVKVKIEKLVRIGDDLPDTIAALAEPFAVAYHVIHRANLHAGDDALVIGGGPIGAVLAVAARAAGANVVISEPNEKRRQTARQLGIAVAEPGEIGDIIAENTEGKGFDVVFEASGSKAGIVSTTAFCKIHGTIVPLALGALPVEFVLGQVSFKEQTVVGSRVYPFLHFQRGVRLLEKLYKNGVVLDPLVSDILPLDDAQKAIDQMIAGENACKILLDARA